MEYDKIENNISLEDKYEELMKDFNMPIMKNSNNCMEEGVYKQFSLYDYSIYDTQISSNIK